MKGTRVCPAREILNDSMFDACIYTGHVADAEVLVRPNADNRNRTNCQRNTKIEHMVCDARWRRSMIIPIHLHVPVGRLVWRGHDQADKAGLQLRVWRCLRPQEKPVFAKVIGCKQVSCPVAIKCTIPSTTF